MRNINFDGGVLTAMAHLAAKKDIYMRSLEETAEKPYAYRSLVGYIVLVDQKV